MMVRRASRRAVLAQAAATGGLGVLAACGTTKGDTTESAPAALRSGVSLTFMFWGAATPDLDRVIIAQRFMERQPGIKIQTVGLPGNDDFDAKVVSMVAGGTAPDVVQVGGRNFGLYAAKFMAQEIASYAKRDKENVEADFLAPTVEYSKWQGKLMALPNDFNCLGVYYNADLFAAAGVPLPPADWKASGWTWQNFVDAGLRVTRRDASPARFALATLGTAITGVAPWLWSNGADILSKDGTKVVLDQPAAVETLQFLQDVRQKHRLVPESSETGGVTGNDLFLNGSTAILIVGAAFTATARKRIENFKWNVGVFPGSKGGRFSSTGGTQGSSWMLPAASANKNEAWAFMRFLASDEQQKFITQGGLIGARKSAAQTARQLNAGQSPKDWGLFLDAEPVARPVPNVPQWTEFDKAFSAEVSKVVAGQSAPREAGARLKEQLEPLLKPA